MSREDDFSSAEAAASSNLIRTVSPGASAASNMARFAPLASCAGAVTCVLDTEPEREDDFSSTDAASSDLIRTTVSPDASASSDLARLAPLASCAGALACVVDTAPEREDDFSSTEAAESSDLIRTVSPDASASSDLARFAPLDSCAGALACVVDTAPEREDDFSSTEAAAPSELIRIVSPDVSASFDLARLAELASCAGINARNPPGNIPPRSAPSGGVVSFAPRDAVREGQYAAHTVYVDLMVEEVAV